MRWLLDEMLPPATAQLLNQRGHGALSVSEVGLASASDEDVLVRAVSEDRVVVTENFKDFALLLRARESSGQPVVPVVLVRKSHLAGSGTVAIRLADRLDSWAASQTGDLPAGLYWP